MAVIIYLGIVRAVQLTTDIVFFERRRHQKNAKPQVLILGLAPCFMLQLRKSGTIFFKEIQLGEARFF